ncbi:MAG: hypothetical protein NT132_12305 [Microbacterium sp.]|uniref:hypothetical protein n=1 Tax=Microbacterium sp. TaxID=51671 RepID=UPI0026386D1A|nr:hypothetical protein [Microbacterium sp.]MCX6503164.1 hypothetical protein [Microbacterium sp.]
MSESTDVATVDGALAPFTEMMAADGYVLSWLPSEADRIVVRIEATDGACADCLVPQPVMEAIPESAAH